MKKEIWKAVDGYEDYYEVSSFGRVRSVDRMETLSNGVKRLRKWSMLKIRKNKNGYLQIQLWKSGEGKTVNIHRLVAEAFIPNPDNLSEVNHKDEDKTNNHVENLEWCDSKYNKNYGTAIQRAAEKHKILFSKPVLQIDLEANQIIAEYPSAIEAGRQLKLNQGSISACCNGKRKTAGCFKWEYKKE